VRWFPWIILLLLGGAYLYSNRSRPAAFAWEHDFDQALARAAEQNRLVLADFYTPWCGACKVMDREVFSRQDVADALSDWVPVKVNCDENEAVAARYGIEAYPTIVALSPQGEIITGFQGTAPAEDFIDWLNKIEPPSTAQGS
jgi:thioredoxin-like negative regulator of GroEL